MRIEETEDIEWIHRLTQAAFAEYGREPGTSTALKETPDDIHRQQIEGNRFLAAYTEANVPVACVRFRFEGDALYFHRLSVDPNHRRQGLATALVARLETLARAEGGEKLACSVRLEKTDNVALYTGLGFQLIGERSVCRDGTPVPTGDFEKNLSPQPPPPDVRRLTGEGGVRPRCIVKGQRVEEGKVIRAREFRSNPTPEEAILWEKLRAGRLNGLKFRRQQIVAGFIVDFYCHRAALAIEIDGSVHDDPGRDAERDAILAGHGILTIRFTNDAIPLHLTDVLTQIAMIATKRLSPFPARNERPGEGQGER